MTTTATHHEHGTTTERVLFMAFELSEKTWKLGFITGHGHKPRERSVAARHQAGIDNLTFCRKFSCVGDLG